MESHLHLVYNLPANNVLLSFIEARMRILKGATDWSRMSTPISVWRIADSNGMRGSSTIVIP
jgi:hypothetical protein